MGAKSQRKGRSGELELCRILNAAGIKAVPGDPLNYGTQPDITGVAGVHVECKRTERLQLYPALEQAQRDAVRFQDGTPAVFHRSNRHPWVVVMALEDWLTLYRRK